MDGQLVKPLQRARLHEALEAVELIRPAPVLTGAEIPNCADPVEELADLVTLRGKFGNDIAFLHRLNQAFVSSVSQLLNELGSAAEAGERTLLRALAHKIKGAGINIHAPRLARLAARIESESASLPPSALGQAIDALRQAFDEVSTYISSELR